MGPVVVGLVFKDSRIDCRISEWGEKGFVLLLFLRACNSGIKCLIFNTDSPSFFLKSKTQTALLLA